MRVLFLTPDLPYPPTTGNRVRDLQFLRRLSARHDLTLVSVTPTSLERIDVQPLARYARVHVVLADDEPRDIGPRWVLNRGRYIFGNYLYKPWQREVRALVRALLAEQQFDLLHVTNYTMWPCIAGLNRPPVVLDLCDANSLRYATSARYAGGTTRVKRYAEVLRTRFWEKRAVANVDRVVVASERDRRALGRDPKVEVVPIGVDHRYFHRREVTRDPNALVFVGVMDYPPNVDAVAFFAREILPRIREYRAEVTFSIVGRNPSPVVRSLGSQPGIRVTGSVPDIRPFLERSTVFVAPIRFASGIQIKVLEAMAMEVPVVATSPAAGGLAVRHGQHLLVADRPGDFARAVLDCLDDKELRTHLSVDAQDFVARNHTWEACCELLEKVYNTALIPRTTKVSEIADI